MPNKQGANAGRGFIYQYAYACERIVDLFHQGTLISATLEGSEDIDLLYTQNGKPFIEIIQVKTREEGGSNWTIKEFTHSVLLPFIMNSSSENEYTSFHFVTDGNPDHQLSKLKREIIPLLIDGHDLDESSQSIITNLCEAIKKQTESNGKQLTTAECLYILKRIKITTRHNNFDTIRHLTYNKICDLGLDEIKAKLIHETFFKEVCRISGLKNVAERKLSAVDIARILGLPNNTIGQSQQNIHHFKRPAQFWYVQRPEDEYLSPTLRGWSNGQVKNLIITGESGIGKSSFLNNIREEAIKLGIITIKLRVFGTNFESFLDQIADEIESQIPEIRPNISPRHARNRLFAILIAFRKYSSKPVLLMIDQFERVFEERNVRIDISLIRDVWKMFDTLIREINESSTVSIVLTARTVYYWIMFPSDAKLDDSYFSYVILQSFTSTHASTLLDNLLSYTDRKMTTNARKVFLENSETEPQLIILAFINLFGDRNSNEAVDEIEMKKKQPWNEVFKNDIEILIKDELQKLVIFAIANIHRELCDIEEITERILLLKTYSRQEVEFSLRQIQNSNRLLNRSKEGLFDFYHRNAGEYILKNYKHEFPAEWAEDGVVWDVHKMVKEELKINKNLQTLISYDKIQIINKYAEKLPVNKEEIILIAKSSLNNCINPEYWIKHTALSDSNILDDILSFLGHPNAEVRRLTVAMLTIWGSDKYLANIDYSITFDFTNKEQPATPDLLIESEALIRDILDLFSKRSYIPDDNKTISWICLSIMFNHEIDYWVKKRPLLVHSAFDIILEDMKSGTPHYIKPKLIGNVVVTVERINNKDISTAFFDFWDNIIKEKYWKKNKHFSDGEDLAKALTSAVSTLINRMLFLSKKQLIAEVESYINFFQKFLYDGFSGHKELIRKGFLNAALNLKISGPHINKIELRLLNEIEKHLQYDSSLEPQLLYRIRNLLHRSSESGELARAIGISIKLNDFESTNDTIEYIENNFNEITFTKVGESLIDQLTKLTVQNPSKTHLKTESLVSLLIQLINLQPPAPFLASNHQSIIKLLESILHNYPQISTTNIFDKIVTHSQNTLLRHDITTFLYLKYPQNLPLRSATQLTATHQWFEQAIPDISNNLILQDEELKGDIFLRMYQYCMLDNKPSKHLLEKAIIAFKIAIKYHNNRLDKYDESYEHLHNCTIKAILATIELDPSTQWISLLEFDDDYWFKIGIANGLLEVHKHNQFHQLVHHLMYEDTKITAAQKEEITGDWLKGAIKNKDYETMILCYEFADTEHIYDVSYCVKGSGKQDMIEQLIAKALASKKPVATAVLVFASDDLQTNINLIKHFYSLKEDNKYVNYYSWEWAMISAAIKNEQLFTLCWQNLNWDEIEKKELEEWIEYHSPVLAQIFESSDNPLIERQLSRSNHPYWLYSLANFIYFNTPNTRKFNQLAERYLDLEYDEFRKRVVAEEWLERATALKNKKLTTLCKRYLDI